MSVVTNLEEAKALADGSFDRALENAIMYGMTEGAKAERARIGVILRSAEPHCVGTAIILALHDGALKPERVRDVLRHVPAPANVIDIAARRAALIVIEPQR
jgi:hypothetical protein